jgi:hypothetical protein
MSLNLKENCVYSRFTSGKPTVPWSSLSNGFPSEPIKKKENVSNPITMLVYDTTRFCKAQCYTSQIKNRFWLYWMKTRHMSGNKTFRFYFLLFLFPREINTRPLNFTWWGRAFESQRNLERVWLEWPWMTLKIWVFILFLSPCCVAIVESNDSVILFAQSFIVSHFNCVFL